MEQGETRRRGRKCAPVVAMEPAAAAPRRPVNSWKDPGEAIRQAIEHYREYEPGSWFKKVRWLRAVSDPVDTEPLHRESPCQKAARLAA
jgi:hypothetical protein